MFNLLLRATPLALAVGLATSAIGQQYAALPTATAPAPIPQLTAEQWQEDLRFMAAEMERRHKNLYHTVSREEFAAAVADLHARIPRLQRNEIIVGMMRIAAMVGDGHTRVDPRKDTKFGFRSLPLKLYLFDDGLYVRAAAPGQADLVGARVEEIGGIPVAEALRRVSEIIAQDNEMAAKLLAPVLLNMPPVLHALRLSSSPDAALLTLRRGKRKWVASVAAAGFEPVWPPDTDVSLVTPEGWVDARKSAQLPLWLQEPLNYHRLIELPKDRTLYAQLNMVTDIKGQTLKQFAEKIGERSKLINPRAVVLDLRLNLGGNGNLRAPLVRELIKVEDEDTRLFVLTARGTFSASQFILDDLDRLSDAIFVGEPASSKPSSYGDAYRIAMPNSGIDVRSSIVWWQAGQNWEPWTYIDVAAPLTFEAYVLGRDPALEAAAKYAPPTSLAEQLIAAGKLGGVDSVRRALLIYRNEPANRYKNLAVELPRAAEYLHFAKQNGAALEVAELATKQFPGSSDAFLVLAFLAEAAGAKDKARAAAKQLLQLDPNNRAVRPLLERLE